MSTQKPDLTGLTHTEKQVWLSVEREGIRPAELARHTRWEPSTIRTMLSRCRKKLEDNDEHN